MGDRSAAARKAARTRKARQKRYSELGTKAKAAGTLFYKKSKQKHAARVAASKRPKKKKKGKKMPANVLKYFKLVGQGMSKEAARKEAGMPPKGKGKKKKWGPGHPLYDWGKKHGKW